MSNRQLMSGHLVAAWDVSFVGLVMGVHEIHIRISYVNVIYIHIYV